MKITVIGGGPAGLYFGILMRLARPDVQVEVLERNKPNDTFGWGVVFSDETLSHFMDADPPTYEKITKDFVHWTDIDIRFGGETIRSGGHGFSGVARKRLLEILQARAAELGVKMTFSTEVDDIESLRKNCDLLIAADGVNSKTRSLYADKFRPSVTPGRAKFIWLGTHCKFDAFKFFVRTNDAGMFQVHAYPFSDDTSTFIVETSEETWRRAGLDKMSIEDGVKYCEELFAEDLDGHGLMTNKSSWINFALVKNEIWHFDNVVLIGDAAHTAHFSIGSGTKLAMEDAIALVDALVANEDIPGALAAYEEARWVDVAKLQNAAKTSQTWFEEIDRYRDDPPFSFSLNLLSRSKRVTYGNLKLRDPKFIEQVNEGFARSCGVQETPAPPPMFTPFRIGELEVPNRVVVSPMCMYSADDGTVNDFHLVHIGARAVGGAGLVICEMTDVSANARISPGCAGLYKDEHIGAWKRVVDFVHENSHAKIGIQLGHAGRKASTCVPWEGDTEPLPEGNWPIVSASAIPYKPQSQVPKAMDRDDMDAAVADYVQAAQKAESAGFDLLEIHMAHGYLLASFLSPITNKRDDEYGGTLENRMRFPLEVFDAVRKVWPAQKPLTARISAVDWIPGGNEPEDAVEIARMLKDHGCALIDVSSGQTDPAQAPEYGRMFQTPFADRIKHEVGIATMAVGAIQGWDHVNTIVAAGRADLCAMARPHLFDPNLTLHAAAELEYYNVPYPDQYRAGKPRPPDPNANRRR